MKPNVKLLGPDPLQGIMPNLDNLQPGYVPEKGIQECWESFNFYLKSCFCHEEGQNNDYSWTQCIIKVKKSMIVNGGEYTFYQKQNIKLYIKILY